MLAGSKAFQGRGFMEVGRQEDADRIERVSRNRVIEGRERGSASLVGIRRCSSVVRIDASRHPYQWYVRLDGIQVKACNRTTSEEGKPYFYCHDHTIIVRGRLLYELSRYAYFRTDIFGVSDEKRKPSVSSSSQ